VDRYSFIVVDLHHLLLAGLPAHFESYMPSQAVGLQQPNAARSIASRGSCPRDVGSGRAPRPLGVAGPYPLARGEWHRNSIDEVVL
jgi:hypothetical protein